MELLRRKSVVSLTTRWNVVVMVVATVIVATTVKAFPSSHPAKTLRTSPLSLLASDASGENTMIQHRHHNRHRRHHERRHPFRLQPQCGSQQRRRNRQGRSLTTRLHGKLWDKLQIAQDDTPAWYVLNCVAGTEMELLSQCRHSCRDLPAADVVKFAVPAERKTLRSHGSNMMKLDERVRYPGYVFCKIRLCPQVYETIQTLPLCRSWMGTVNIKGHKKLPPAPVALSEEEVAKFRGLEDDENDQDEDGGAGEFDRKENEEQEAEMKLKKELLKQYQGLEVDGMVKVLAGNFKGEDGVVKRLKDGQVLVRMYTYGSVFDEWFEPKNVRPLTEVEVMRGLSGPTKPITQQDFDAGVGKRRTASPRDLRGKGLALTGAAGGGGGGRNRRQDRIARGEIGSKDWFGRSREEVEQEEQNWREYRERQRQDNRRGPKSGPKDTWGMKSRSSWTGGDDAVYDVDGQWGRSDRTQAPGKSQRQMRREQKGVRQQQLQRPRRGQSEGVERAVEGAGDWSDFAAGTSLLSTAEEAEDDFFASLMSELSDNIDTSEKRTRAGEGGDSRQEDKRAATKTNADEEDDFFSSLMSELSDTLDDGTDNAVGRGGGKDGMDEDDFFASLETELGSSLDGDEVAKETAPTKSGVGTKSSKPSSTGDDFFASLENELDASLGTDESADVTGGRSDNSVFAENDDEDFFAMLENEIQSNKYAEGGEQENMEKLRSSSSSEEVKENDFFASLEEEITSPANRVKSESSPSTEKSDSPDGLGVDEDDFSASLEAEMSPSWNGNQDTTDTDTLTKEEVKPKPKKSIAIDQGVSSDVGTGVDEKRNVAAELSKLTVADLKEKLRERGLKVSGKKSELIERLQQAN